jgi:sugar lactone lactonase YvrE
VSPVERALRQAYREAAQTVTWADIASAAPVPDPAGRRRRRRRERLVKPLLAAVAVAVIAAIAIAAPALLGNHRASPAGGHHVRPGHRRSGPPAPRFFAALRPDGDSVQVRSASTGRLVAEVLVPARGEFFTGIAATGAAGRTLLVMAERDSGPCKSQLYQVQLSATGRPGPLTAEDSPGVHGGLVGNAFAATPDGAAVAFYDYCQGSGSLEIEHRHGGQGSTWVAQSGDQVDGVSLSASGGELSFSGYAYAGLGPGAKAGSSSVRIRPVTVVLPVTPGSRMLDGQGVVVVAKYTVSALSPDGKTLYVCASHGRLDVLDAYDVATRTVQRVLASWPGSGGSCSFALDATGTHAVIDTAAGHTSAGTGHVSVLDIATGTLTTVPVAGLSSSDHLAW